MAIRDVTASVPGTAPSESGGTAVGVRPTTGVPALVDAAWSMAHLDDPGVRFVEVDDRPGRTRERLPGSVIWAWDRDLCDPIRRDIAGAAQVAELLGRSGIDSDTHIVLYGDPANWFAAWAYWLLKLHGVDRVSLLDGGRSYWFHHGLPMTVDPVAPAPRSVTLNGPSSSQRAFRADVLDRLGDESASIVDVRSTREYTGELIAPPGLTETAQRGGHIPGAISIPWDSTVAEDGTFLDPSTLRRIYEGAGVDASKDVIVYCRIGERSSHTWFVLHELLGYQSVRNYDGSWTEWGSAVGLPIER